MNEKEPPERKKSLKSIAARLLGSLLIIILSLEVLLQLFTLVLRGNLYPILRSRAYPPLYRHDEALGWRVLPNLSIRAVTDEFSWNIKTDDGGFRKLPEVGEHPILISGDSFAFGWGVEAEDCFAARLGKDHGIAVKSLGVPGYGLEQERELLSETLSSIQPAALIQEVWPLDWDILNADQMVEVDHYLVSRDRLLHAPKWWIPARIRLVNTSALFGMIDRIETIVRENKRGKSLLEGYGLDAFTDGKQPEKVTKARERAFNALRAIHKIAEERGLPFMVVVVPSSFQIYDGDLSQWTALYGISGKADIDRPERELREFADDEGIKIIDLLPSFREEAKKRKDRLYYRTDPHWNSAGHSLAAKVIGEEIKGFGGDPEKSRQ